MSAHRVQRWRRYGKDRLYVSSADRQLGWLDLQDAAVHADDAGDESTIREAASNWCHENNVVWPSGANAASQREGNLSSHRVEADTITAPEPATAAGVTASPVDLAMHRPGELARQRAEQEYVELQARGRKRAWLKKHLDIRTEERSWRVGADGEELVGERLEKLSRHGFRVLHSVPVGNQGADIDHILIGTSGVFTVNTKRHPDGRVWVRGDTVKVNGSNVPYVRNARFEARRAQQQLIRALGWQVPVTGVIVIVTGRTLSDLTIKQAPSDVVIVPHNEAPRWFRRQPAKLDPHHVDLIYDKARWSDTWR